MKLTCQAFPGEGGSHAVLVVVPDVSWPGVRVLLDKSALKHNQYLTLDVSLPHKPRTTGERSQNHHFNGHVQQIAHDQGWDFDDAKRLCKRKAVPLGYPPPREVRLSDGIYALYKSEADCSTTECAALIEGAHLLAAEIGCELVEEKS